ncbi:hypothetical protein Q7C36_018967 [Tachysurus vachellii]|uniref:Uncharacterized protein n=1 Tax=Tachysurus vachellii TaxID=175792 RepID=A0AA88LVP3_TACVA|nr:hypothetical protein Q7C36_018967 [Tachysurus vachellii]
MLVCRALLQMGGAALINACWGNAVHDAIPYLTIPPPPTSTAPTSSPLNTKKVCFPTMECEAYNIVPYLHPNASSAGQIACPSETMYKDREEVEVIEAAD